MRMPHILGSNPTIKINNKAKELLAKLLPFQRFSNSHRLKAAILGLTAKLLKKHSIQEKSITVVEFYSQKPHG
ncbi:MAG: hypothetical protein ACI9Y1_003218 [Lentisphaeria bacterium]|jgi:hypothetical protein